MRHWNVQLFSSLDVFRTALAPGKAEYQQNFSSEESLEYLCIVSTSNSLAFRVS